MEEKLFNEFQSVSRDEWLKKITTDLKGKPIEDLNWEVAGLKGGPVYTKEDLPEVLPEVANFNPQPEVFGDRHWVNYQWIQVTSAKEANQQALHALNNGAEGLIFQVNTSVDLNPLLAGIGLAYCHVSFVDETQESNLIDDFVSYVSEQNTNPHQVQGYYLGSADISKAIKSLPAYKLINISASDKITDATPVQELALSLSKTALIFDQLTEGGQPIAALFHQLQFQLSIGTSYFTEIAKYRAMRSLAIRFASAYDLSINASDVKILAQTGNWTESIDDVHSHMLRATTEAISAIVGGTDALCVQPFYNVFDENQKALAERAARNISSVLKEESYLNKVVDPSSGSYFVESLTADITEATWHLFLEIEAAGGYAEMDVAKIKSLTGKSSDL